MSSLAVEVAESSDISIFKVESQSTSNDKTSFLKIQNFVARRYAGFTYLEVGSHLGGTLFPYLSDERCGAVISYDPRPLVMGDERGRLEYEDNSTQRMLYTLKKAGGPGITAKLKTYDSDISAADPKQIGSGVRVALIDAEHTNRAAFRDFLHVFSLVEKDSVIAFHDSDLLVDALMNTDSFLKYSGVNHRIFFLPDAVFLIAFGSLAEPASVEFGSIARDPEIYYAQIKQNPRDVLAKELSQELGEVRRHSYEQGRMIDELRSIADGQGRMIEATRASLNDQLDLRRELSTKLDARVARENALADELELIKSSELVRGALKVGRIFERRAPALLRMGNIALRGAQRLFGRGP